MKCFSGFMMGCPLAVPLLPAGQLAGVFLGRPPICGRMAPLVSTDRQESFRRVLSMPEAYGCMC